MSTNIKRYFRGRSEPKVFPIRESSKKFDNESRESTKDKIASTLQSSGHACGNYKGMNAILSQVGIIGKNAEATRVYDPDGIARTIKNGGGMGAKTGLYAIDLKTAHGSSKTRKGGIKHNESQTLDHNCSIGIANTVTPDAYLATGKRKRVNGKAVLPSMHERRIRRLTPIECERLQGFPDNWTAKGNFNGEIKGISDTQRYKLMGNAVTVDIVEMIGKKLMS